MWTAVTAAAVLLFATGPTTKLEQAQMRVESGGKFWKVGGAGDRGLWQVTPIGWQAVGQELGIPPRSAQGQLWRKAHVVVHLPRVNLTARRIIMRRWGRYYKGGLGPALRAYNCGTEGIYRRCGAGYLEKIKHAGGTW